MYRDNFVNRPGLARFLQVSAGTLGVWQTKQCYDLPCEKIGKNVYYAWDDVFRFISTDDEDFNRLLQLGDKKPLLTRKDASRYANTSLSSLIKTESKGTPLRPRRIGHVIRYRREEVDEYLKWRKRQLNAYYEERMNPYLFL